MGVRRGPMNQEEIDENRMLHKSLSERIKQLRLVQYMDIDEYKKFRQQQIDDMGT